jgi:hypothetical protein
MDILNSLLPFSLDEIINKIADMLGFSALFDFFDDLLPDIGQFTAWLDPGLTGFIRELQQKLEGFLNQLVLNIKPFLDNIE